MNVSFCFCSCNRKTLPDISCECFLSVCSYSTGHNGRPGEESFPEGTQLVQVTALCVLSKWIFVGVPSLREAEMVVSHSPC